MNCDDFQKIYENNPLHNDEDFIEHHQDCRICSDWIDAKKVELRGFKVSDFPCVHMAREATYQCEDEHFDVWGCPDQTIEYIPKFNEYGIPIRDGGSSLCEIQYCPWCGVKLPESKRDEWCERFLDLDIMPDEAQSDAWWRGFSIWDSTLEKN